MGNILSGGSTGEYDAGSGHYTSSESETMNDVSTSRESNESEIAEEQFHDTISEDEDQSRAKIKEEEMEEFRKQLSLKREQRKEILARHRAEKMSLEKSLEAERVHKLELTEKNRLLQELLIKNNIEIPETLWSKETSDVFEAINQMKEEFEKLKSNNNKLRCDLANTNNALQAAYSDIADLSAQNTESIKQITALKEVIAVSKTLIHLREQQLNDLKDKLNEIEQSLADRETNILSVDLRQEYERQLQNIRTLRGLYEERARLAEVTRLALVRELEEQKLLNQAEVTKCKNLTANVEELESKVISLENTIEEKSNQIASCQEESRGLKAEMAVVNKLFSQVLLGYKSKQDLDTLVHRLEENHGLLTHMAERENDSESSSALPKMLLELVSQVDANENNDSEKKLENKLSPTQDAPIIESGSQSNSSTTAEEIVQNLPKVWRVLIELLSHQSEADANTAEKVTTCYKSVETNSGPVLVPSVSQTYIRLKDLIIEKLSLIKEVNRMKQLNTHLESRLGEQEKRLCLVTTELSKTWHVVGRLRRHHHQLHTHEKILKYELQQKRKLLNELKEELEYCREKWEQAREKNTQSERDWKKLRAEFSNRKIKPNTALLNNSAESGYSDERPSDESSESNDESEYVTEPKIRCKKKNKKSFETIIDSSTDFNLAAEREDPASDMLDVADLPLDTQDEVPEVYSVSDSCNSENLLKSDKVCEETEDEVGDIAIDSCREDTSIIDNCQNITTRTSNDNTEIQNTHDNFNTEKDQVPDTSSGSNTLRSPVSLPVIIDASAILKSIKEQNERLAKRDKKLDSLERGGVALLKKTQSIAKLGEQINNTLDHLINRPTSSRQFNSSQNSVSDSGTTDCVSELTKNVSSDEIQNDITDTEQTSEEFVNINLNDSESAEINKSSMAINKPPENYSEPSSSVASDASQNPEINSNVSNNGQESENVSLELSTNISDTRLNGDSDRNELESAYTEHIDKNEENTEPKPLKENNIEEAGGSNTAGFSEMDHEARFAARDLRLKRLEEQTKSLVTKVNKTTTKGVKIHYKLEELHNIYGSDHSRSGTPSDESSQDDISQGKDDTKENHEQN